MKFFKTPRVIKLAYPGAVWDLHQSNKNLYLTFDDGPQPELTEYILSILDRYNAKATFFCVGDNIRKFPGLVKKIIEHGHLIGNHTFNHLDGWKSSTVDYSQNIELFEEEYEGLFNCRLQPQLFRPPYGKITRKQMKAVHKKGYKIIMWDILTYDFDIKLDKTRALNQIIKRTRNGSIILFHDNIKATKNLQYLLPNYLDYFAAKEYRFPIIPLNL